MKIESGTTFETRNYSVEVSDQDGLLQFGERWETMGVMARAKALSKIADIMVVDYMHDEGIISEEYAQNRIRAIKAR